MGNVHLLDFVHNCIFYNSADVLFFTLNKSNKYKKVQANIPDLENSVAGFLIGLGFLTAVFFVGSSFCFNL